MKNLNKYAETVATNIFFQVHWHSIPIYGPLVYFCSFSFRTEFFKILITQERNKIMLTQTELSTRNTNFSPDHFQSLRLF